MHACVCLLLLCWTLWRRRGSEAGWRYVRLRGQWRLLRPLLVTGCKVWHVRPASRFYPKVQFFETLAALRDGAQVVMLLGEIDCREGLLLAVQKCKVSGSAAGGVGTATAWRWGLGAGWLRSCKHRAATGRSNKRSIKPAPPAVPQPTAP